MDTLIPQLAVLPEAQRRLWPELKPAQELGFTLYGGTAIALRLGHRNSIDFDFFTDRDFSFDSLSAAFPFIQLSRVLQREQDTLTVLAPFGDSEAQHVKVSFFGNLKFGRVGEPSITDDGVMQIASLDDLMATKLKVILQRVEVKDYQDLAAMISAGVNVEKGLASAISFYGPQFPPSEALRAMTYFEGGDLDALTEDEKTILVRAASQGRDLPDSPILSRHLTAKPSSKDMGNNPVIRTKI